ncbi:MAG: Hsp20/alpha crystallin family protein [Planctomycetota bacterium]
MSQANTASQRVPATDIEAAGANFENQPHYSPAVDVLENADGVTLHLDMPGVAREDLEVSLEYGALTVRGIARPRSRVGMRRVLEESLPGVFERTFRVSNVIDSAGINADLKDGVLSLRLPRAAETRPRKIVVNSA